MFIAHMPAGYLLMKFMGRGRLSWKTLAAGFFGSIAPDLDLMRFYLLDDRQIHHHKYWTHIPVIWVVMWFAIRLVYLHRDKPLPLPWLCFFACALLHLLLDTVAGDIMWFWPISEYSQAWVTVPATHSPWYMSFVHHWTFKVEILICAVALCLGVLSPKRS